MRTHRRRVAARGTAARIACVGDRASPPCRQPANRRCRRVLHRLLPEAIGACSRCRASSSNRESPAQRPPKDADAIGSHLSSLGRCAIRYTDSKSTRPGDQAGRCVLCRLLIRVVVELPGTVDERPQPHVNRAVACRQAGNRVTQSRALISICQVRGSRRCADI